VSARAIGSLWVAVALSACGSEPGARAEPPAAAERSFEQPVPIAVSNDFAVARPGALLRLIELPAPGPYHLMVLPHGRLVASRPERTLLIDERGGVARELPFGGLVASDSDGHLFIAGEFSERIEIGRFRHDSAGGLDAFVAKLDSDWTPVWVRQLGSAAQERPRRLATHGTDVIVMGTGIGTQKLDRDGATLWSTALAGSDFAVQPEGTLLLVGGFIDELLIGAEAHYADQPSMFLAKLDAQGSPLWSRIFTGTSVAHAERVSLDPDGNLALVGAFRGSLSLGGPALFHDSTSGEAYSAGFFAKLDGEGNHLCSQRSQIANHFALAADTAGNFVLTGHASDDDPLLELRVLGPDGGELWHKSGPTDIELGAGYGFDVALDGEQLHWSLDAYSKSLAGAVLVPHVATLAL
jgi:hypothetical protein